MSTTATVERRIRTPRHVNLRTLQRRLRHVKSLAIRSLKSPEAILWDPLAVKVKFTLHDLENKDRVLYTSSSLEETYNPSWRSLLFQYDNLEEKCTLSKFLIRVWLTVLSRNEDILCFEKIIDLNMYVFLGPNIARMDDINHSINSVIIATAEGYYCHYEGGGYPTPHRPGFNELSHYLPRNSLIEVAKASVNVSYNMKDLNKMIEQQCRLTTLRTKLKLQKEQILKTRQQMAISLSKREGYTCLKARVELLKRQLTEQRKAFETENHELNVLRSNLNERTSLLNEYQKKLTKSQTQYQNDNMIHLQRRDQLTKTQRKLYLRQRTLISELSQTYCIKQLNDAFTICDVILPHGDPMESGSASAEQTGVALGFVAHLVSLLAHFLLIPLQYPINAAGSRATIIDNIHIGLEIREFPLYYKGTEKSLYQFGLYLLWRDILQVRQHSGFTTSKSNTKRTLFNLKHLLDKLMTDKYSIYSLKESSLTPAMKVTAQPINLSLASPAPLSSYFNNSFSTSPFETDNCSTTPLSMEIIPDEEVWSSLSDHTQHSPRLRSSPLVSRSTLSLGGTPPRMRPKDEPTSPEMDNPFQLSESPSRKTIYMLDVPKRKFSDADNFLMKFSVEESLPASLPLSSSSIPPTNNRHGYRIDGQFDNNIMTDASHRGSVLYSDTDTLSEIKELSIISEETIGKNN